MQWDHEVDVLVIGSGNGAMTAALSAYELGLKDVLLLEKADKFGGTSSVSGGGIWIPNSHYSKAAGAQDSLDEARAYLKDTTPADEVPWQMVDNYLQNAPKMLKFLSERSEHIDYISLGHYPDYYMQSPGARDGHRSLEPQPIKKSDLGDDMHNLVDTHHMIYMLDRIGMTQEEAQILMTRAKGWIGLTMKLFANYLTDFGWLFKNKRSRRITCGSAGVARLFLALKDRNIPLWLESPMKELITEDGKVVGVLAEKNGKPYRIKANKGVILAAGGFEKNQQMRDQYLPKPTNASWSGGVDTNTGDAHIAGMAVGADTRLMNSAWWCTTISAPDEPAPRLAIIEKSMPGSCVVNMRGERIANESQNYMAYQRELFDKHSADSEQVPAYMVFDNRFRKEYVVGPLLTKGLRPDSQLPKSYFENGFMAIADNIDDLADKLGIDKAGLNSTVKNMNEDSVAGKDREFGRGDTAYDQYYGDATVTPNPCMAPINEGPFYAIRIDPGDFGTHGGLQTNINAQVIREDGSAIDGLYACGNCSAAILPTYPGPGSTLGPAMTYGWLAAKHLAGVENEAVFRELQETASA
ncbi:3-oxosteroid 1-dehydrogenase [Sinobacterium norvegicum]|uniref:3-oxosteroid 1-dehydrogenase n=1 Tax=Sinobacterium norvegicum TaxID=1641715 RepID=A0ABM9AHW8_9GAMM|nr:FAD-dependent oxidoreductase [Sinobacterium norvegicum]CAH0992347.1 3-oxosteroid 1-dehydrogenase [Sinobacterium norvegicum]